LQSLLKSPLLKLSKSKTYFLEVCLFSIILHLIVAVLFFCITAEFIPTRIAISPQDDRPIVVVPFARSIAQKSKEKNTFGTSVNSQKKSTKNKVETKRSANLVTLADNRFDKKKKSVAQTKKNDASVARSQSIAKLEKKKEVPAAATQTVKETKEPMVPSEKRETTTNVVTEDDVILLGQQEFDAYQIGSQLRTALADHWQRPAGVGNVMCSFRVTIGEDGRAIRIEDEALSKIVVFDIAARMAIEQTIFPKRVIGKTIVLEFS
jgi:hypothetical protein